MATYKQRTRYQRPSTHSDDDDTQSYHASQANNTTVASSTAHPIHFNALHHNSHRHQHHNTSNTHHFPTEDDIFENTLDREWTSVRNSTSARARARQQQYLEQQQQRTREWQLVLSQHHRPLSTSTTQTASRATFSDEYDEVLSSNEPLSMVASSREAGTNLDTAGTVSIEHSSAFGFSDLTSDGLESVDESEDLGVWSHEDDDDTFSLSAPALRRLSTSSSPLAASSTISLSHLARPSFAASPYGKVTEFKFQNQMPFHDGSGNFATGKSVHSYRESDIDSDLGWESSSSRASSILRPSRPIRPRLGVVRRRISSSEFRTVIQNIADLQHTNTRQSFKPASRSRSVDGRSIASSSNVRTHFTYPHVVTKRPIFNIYESEMEDLADMMIELPEKMGWVQAFEKALRVLSPGEYDVREKDPSMVCIKNPHAHVNPIKALAFHLAPEDADMTDQQDSAVNQDNAPLPSVDTMDNSGPLQEVKQNMSAASLDTLKQLQTRKRSRSPHQRSVSDPMQVEFLPTVGDMPVVEDAQYNGRRMMSRSTGTSTSRMKDGNLLAVVLSTLRRFRDHVETNLLQSEFYEEDDGHGDLSRSLGFDGDLGVEWLMGGKGGREHGDVQSQTRTERSPSVASSTRSSAQSIHRVNSDCGLESMKHYMNRDSNRPIHTSHHPRPSFVE
ncbi:hypothetical protein BGZ51_003467 [Haplosporangium sp. Z 767]|nr:hypothetical protein BGZ51_003467 [Haplosporangium sp. Z 767]KAF9184937.1 hypothetical protein BGZ50_003391 [Haplosporangium sp. Z 11]